MKNSKFLKKSLALVLAIMMVFGAMIPTGASAATAPTFETIVIAGKTITPVSTSGITTSISTAQKIGYTNASEVEVPLLFVLRNDTDSTKVYFGADAEAASANEVSSGGNLLLSKLTANDAGTEYKGVFVTATGEDKTVYPLTINITPPSSDSSIKDFRIAGQVSSSVNAATRTITVVMPYTDAIGSTVDNIALFAGPATTPSSTTDDASVLFNANNGNWGAAGGDPALVASAQWAGGGKANFYSGGSYVSKELQVKAETGVTDVWTVNVTEAVGFTSFAIAGAESAEIDEATSKITVVMPYGTKIDAENLLTATFRTGLPSTVSLEDGTLTDVALTSGKAADFTGFDDNSDAELVITRTGTAETRTYELDLTVNPLNPNAAITALSVVADRTDATGTPTAPVDGTVNETAKTLTAVLGSVANLGDVDLTITASAEATVEIPLQAGQTAAVDASGTPITLSGVDATAPVTIKVIPDDTSKPAVLYTLTLTKVGAPATATITSFSLVNETDAEDVINAVINNTAKTIKFTVPYGMTNDELGDYKVLYGVNSPGVIVGYYDGSNFDTLLVRGSTVDAGADKAIPNIYGSALTSRVKASSEAEPNRVFLEYTVSFTRSAPATGKDLLTFATTYETNPLTDATTYAGAINATKTPKEVVITYPYGDYTRKAGFKADQLAVLTTSDKAVAYYFDGSDYQPIKAAVKDADGNINNDATVIDMSAATEDSPITVYVLSEELAFDAKGLGTEGADISVADFEAAIGEDPSNATKLGKTTKYALYGKAAAPRTGNALSAFGFVDGKGNTIPAKSVDTATRTVTVEVPYTYAATATKLYPVFTVSAGAIINTDATGDVPSGEELLSGGDLTLGKLDETQSRFIDLSGPWAGLDADKLYTDPIVPNFYKKGGTVGSAGDVLDTLENLYVFDESGLRVNPYTLVVKVLEPKTGAQLSAFGIGNTAGVINDTDTAKTVRVTVPLGTSTNTDGRAMLLGVKPTYRASEMATVTIGGRDIADEAGFDFEISTPSNEVTYNITVASEDGKASFDYILTVYENTTFPDVPATAWYAESVYDAVAYGLIKGMDDGTFQPNANLTRGQFAVIIGRMFMTDEEMAEYESAASFTDVTTQYYANAVKFCVDKGIVDGYDDGTFKGGNNVKRNEMATMICRALNLTPVTTPTTLFADDANLGWAKGFIYACKEAGILEGTNNVFNPQNNARRSEAAKVSVLTYEMLKGLN